MDRTNLGPRANRHGRWPRGERTSRTESLNGPVLHRPVEPGHAEARVPGYLTELRYSVYSVPFNSEANGQISTGLRICTCLHGLQ